MQDNVSLRRTVTALLISLTIFILLLAASLTFLITPDTAYYPSAVTPIGYSEASVENGVTYIGSGFRVSERTERVAKGQTAKVILTTTDTEEIEISVYYASGKSSSSVFIPKSAENGKISWEWNVPERTTADTIRIVLRGADTYATFKIDIE